LSGVTATTINENGTTTLSGSISDPGALDTFALVIDWGNGFTETVNYPAGTTSFSETYTYLDDNPTGTPSDNYTINLSLTDDDTGNDTASTSVTVNNVAPSITSISTAAINEGGTANLAVAFTDPGTLDTFTAVVDWGDGSTPETINLSAGTTSFNATHAYPDDDPTGTASDNYTIAVTLTDDDTGADSDSTTLTVNNVAPTLSGFTAPSSINEGDVVTVTANISDPGVEDSFTVVVNWGDGSTPSTINLPAGTTSFEATHAYPDDDPTATPADNYTIAVTLTDDDTGSDNDSAAVTVNNVAPVLSNLGANSTIDENQTITVTGNLSDVGVEDTFTLEVDWADGSAVETFTYPAGTTSFSFSHTYTDDTLVARWLAQGTFTIDLTLTDDDTGSDNDSINVDVNNVAPTIVSTNHTDTITENGTVDLAAVFSDPSPDDTFVATIQWGDGSANTVLNLAAGATSFNSSHVYLDDNLSGTASDNYTITITLQDDNGGSVVEQLAVTVDNVAPEVAAGPDGSAAVGTPLNFSGVFTDVGTLDTHLIVWDMGDGTLITGTLTPTHTYTTPGLYTVTLTVTDDDTGVGSDQLQMQVLEVATPIYLPLVVHNLQLFPDLVVDSITVSSNDVQIVIRNQGDAAVALADEFWVDLYLNPDTAPTHVNEIWQDVGDEGLVWGITDVSALVPNGTLTINLSHPSFMPEFSNFSGTFASGDVVYVQVDSAHINTTYGAVLENHEQENLPYNNINTTTVSDGRSKTPRPLVKPAGVTSTTLPPR
jgi:PKD repeat protein